MSSKLGQGVSLIASKWDRGKERRLRNHENTNGAPGLGKERKELGKFSATWNAGTLKKTPDDVVDPVEDLLDWIREK